MRSGKVLSRSLERAKQKSQACLGVRPSRGGRTATQSRTTLGCFDPNTAAALDQPHHKSGDHASCRRLFFAIAQCHPLPRKDAAEARHPATMTISVCPAAATMCMGMAMSAQADQEPHCSPSNKVLARNLCSTSSCCLIPHLQSNCGL